MFRVPVVLAIVVIAAAAAAQTVKDLTDGSETTPTLIPEIPAGADPMAREPDPAADTPAAKAPPRPIGGVGGDADCYVRRAETDTGFVVVCEERNDG